MRRPCRVSVRQMCALLLSAALVFTTPALATADEGDDSPEPSTATLVVEVAQARQRLADLGAEIQIQQESVNRMIVELAGARQTLQAAEDDARGAQQVVAEADTTIAAAQRRVDETAVSLYMAGPSPSWLSAESPDDVLGAATARELLASGHRRILEQLERDRLELVNRESLSRLAQDRARAAAIQAQQAQEDAVSALVGAQSQFARQQVDVDLRVAELDAARQRLVEANRPAASMPEIGTGGLRTEEPTMWDREPADELETPGLWDTTLPAVPSANVQGDPIAIINAVLQISYTSTQVTATLGRNFLTGLGILSPQTAATDPGITNGRIPRVYGRQASEYVIRRAMSQIGVPYSWGGGNANGPSRGIDQGANTVGFDCSGLILYAFAGVGIQLEHYSGSQYTAGRQIPSSQMRRGDLIFYGPNASQHEALYLGDGMMLEAPYTGSVVKVSPVRTSGMTPYVTRLIEW